MKEQILDFFISFNGFLFILNLVFFIFSKQIIGYIDTSDLE